MSILSTVLLIDDVVISKLPFLFVFDVGCMVITVEDQYHVILADGMQYDDVHVRFSCSPANTVIFVGNKVTDVTGPVKKNK